MLDDNWLKSDFGKPFTYPAKGTLQFVGEACCAKARLRAAMVSDAQVIFVLCPDHPAKVIRDGKIIAVDEAFE